MSRSTLPLVLAAVLSAVVGCGRGDASTPVEQGQTLLRRGHYDDAITALDDAVRIDPRSADAYLYRGRAYHCRNETGDLDAAIEDFTEAIELAPKNHEAYYSRAIALRDRSEATDSAQDSQQSQADHAMARKFDPTLARERLSDISTPPKTENDSEPADTALDDLLLAPEPETRESAADVIRRHGLEAAAAGQGGEIDALRDKDLLPGGRSGFSSPRADNNSRPRETARSRRLRREERRAIVQPPTNTSADRFRLPTAAPTRGLPAGSPLDPRSGASVGSLAPLSPARGNLAPRSFGGTLPPVATSPFSTRSPTVAPSIPGASPYRSPYQSPFPQSRPRPTGYVEPPLTVPRAGAQPRTLYSPGTRRANPPPTVLRDSYRFP